MDRSPTPHAWRPPQHPIYEVLHLLILRRHPKYETAAACLWLLRLSHRMYIIDYYE